MTRSVKPGLSFLPALLSLFATFIAFQVEVMAQGFGRNKPSYRTFDFSVYTSPNFEIYHYFTDDSVVSHLAHLSEVWYQRHLAVFRDSISVRNPIIIYETHPDFQQTTAISGEVGIGTLGVAEALKNRVIFPILETNAQTNHVLGHEIVHAFQFDLLTTDDSLSLQMLQNLPLWFVEGKAEYLSIGSKDAHTAMIIRDALINDDFPTIRDMARQHKYNPYRFGHAWWAYVAGVWGDTIISPLFYRTAQLGYEAALKMVLGIDHKTLSERWRTATEAHFAPFICDSLHANTGRRILLDRNAGEINISPSASPDGRWVAFFSEKSLFTLDLFIADANTGRVKRKLTSTTRRQDIDGFNFFESVGSWSPDSKQFVYVVVSRGRHKLAIVDVRRPRRTRIIEIEEVPSLNNPSWSPDGRHIAFTGLRNGRSDLYLHDLETGTTQRLTNDFYSYVHPSWSHDGKRLIFATDRKQPGDLSTDINYQFNLAMISIDSPETIHVLPVFKGADNLNPHFSADGNSVYFLSNNDGMRNLYRYNLENLTVYRLTNLRTGISGITHLSPALSLSRKTGNFYFSVLEDRKYVIYSATANDFNPVRIDPTHINFTAATFPPTTHKLEGFVNNNLVENSLIPLFPADSFQAVPFRPRFQLDHIGSSGVGVSTSTFGTGMAGGVFMLFGDMIGNNQLFTSVSLNGEIYDAGAQVGFLNQKHKIKWGASVSHIPYRFSFFDVKLDTISVDGDPMLVQNLMLYNHRMFESQISLFAWYPFSTTRRLEFSSTLALYYFRTDVINNYYQGQFRIGQSRERRPSEPGFDLHRISLAYVGDNSYFGMASPMMGHRFRIQAEQFFGQVQMLSATVDFRQYFRLKPVTLAGRLSHFGRYGKNAENNLFHDYFLGFPWFVRGYSSRRLNDLDMFREDDSLFYNLVGSKIALASFEVRLPLTGVERLAVIPTGFLFTELALFADAGLAWTSNNLPTLNPALMKSGRRFPVFSTGMSLRINLFGAMILEPYYAFPFIHQGITQGVWGLNFLPGW